MEDAGNANPDNQFRYAVIQNAPGYIFNLKTTGLAPGTYALVFMVSGDPTLHRAQFKVR